MIDALHARLPDNYCIAFKGWATPATGGIIGIVVWVVGSLLAAIRVIR